tara:strand:+ start:268 stop:441 length:174 start_codon:yes stop_codon:yes gene_type:complete
MPGMNERKRYMRGETKTARGDYGIKGYKYGGKVKVMPGYGPHVSSSISRAQKKDRRP